MAQSKPSKRVPASGTLGSHTYVFGLAFVVLSVSAAWFMRIKPVLHDVPKDMQKTVEVGKLEQGSTLRKQYTNNPIIDDTLSMLVTAFIAGPANFDYSIYLQQAHFLLGFFSILCVWTIEGCRERNKWTPLWFLSLWAFFYQTMGGAIIIPLHNLCYLFMATRQSYFTSGRAVRLPVAKALLPALTLGFLVPTILLYIPGLFSMPNLMGLVAYWQFTPVIVNPLLFVFTNAVSLINGTESKSGTSSNLRTQDVPYLKAVYATGVIVSMVSHIWVMYEIFTTPSLSFASVFIPNFQKAQTSTSQGLHYIFQVDWVIIAAAELIWTFLTCVEVKRLGVKTSDLAVEALIILICALLMGPGGAVAFFWWWREDNMVKLEQDEAGKAKKSQ